MSKILRRKHIIERTGLSKSTIYELIQKGKFPKQIQLSARSVGWLETEIDQWINSKLKN